MHRIDDLKNILGKHAKIHEDDTLIDVKAVTEYLDSLRNRGEIFSRKILETILSTVPNYKSNSVDINSFCISYVDIESEVKNNLKNQEQQVKSIQTAIEQNEELLIEEQKEQQMSDESSQELLIVKIIKATDLPISEHSEYNADPY